MLVKIPYALERNPGSAECAVLKAIPLLGFLRLVAAVVKLQGKKYPEILVADNEINVLLSDFMKIFHIVAPVSHCEQIFDAHFGADQTAAAVRFAAEQKIELILPFGKDMLWSVWVIISAPQMEQQTDDGNDDDYDGYCRKIM